MWIAGTVALEPWRIAVNIQAGIGWPADKRDTPTRFPAVISEPLRRAKLDTDDDWQRFLATRRLTVPWKKIITQFWRYSCRKKGLFPNALFASLPMAIVGPAMATSRDFSILVPPTWAWILVAASIMAYLTWLQTHLRLIVTQAALKSLWKARQAHRDELAVNLTETRQTIGAKPKNGRPAAIWWPDFAEELAAYVHEKGLPDGTGADGQSEMINAIFAQMKERQNPNEPERPEPSRTSVQPVISAVLTRLRLAGK